MQGEGFLILSPSQKPAVTVSFAFVSFASGTAETLIPSESMLRSHTAHLKDYETQLHFRNKGVNL
ncbi:hypothetical protein [Deinococcus misasensis]|uniref:hypothetical protein n=1 Tax=Deinococcus misasensis TaxID=392413 RepID=UPI0012FA92E5|nr:hypothetical protein [Deinococcus misasensis]